MLPEHPLFCLELIAAQAQIMRSWLLQLPLSHPDATESLARIAGWLANTQMALTEAHAIANDFTVRYKREQEEQAQKPPEPTPAPEPKQQPPYVAPAKKNIQ